LLVSGCGCGDRAGEGSSRSSGRTVRTTEDRIEGLRGERSTTGAARGFVVVIVVLGVVGHLDGSKGSI